MTGIVINSEKSLEDRIVFLREQFEKHKHLRVSILTGKQRSPSQNAALHVFCKLVADALNKGGFDFRVFIKDGFPVPFSADLVKEYLWRPVQKAITSEISTTQPKFEEYYMIYDSLNVKLAEHGIHVPWPVEKDNAWG